MFFVTTCSSADVDEFITGGPSVGNILDPPLDVAEEPRPRGPGVGAFPNTVTLGKVTRRGETLLLVTPVVGLILYALVTGLVVLLSDLVVGLGLLVDLGLITGVRVEARGTLSLTSPGIKFTFQTFTLSKAFISITLFVTPLIFGSLSFINHHH